MEKFIKRFKGRWTNYLIQFPFEWWITLTFRDLVKSEYAKIKLKAWTRKLIKEEKLQIAYVAVINEVNRIHLHLLALGKNRHGKTLNDVSIERWQKEWAGQSRIQIIYDVVGISRYFEHNIVLKDNNLSEVLLFNLKLLKKVQTSKNLIKLDGVKEWDFNQGFYVPHIDKKSVQSQMKQLVEGFK